MTLGVCVQSNSGTGLDDALVATVDAQEWRLEVERVLPSLKIHVKQDNRVNTLTMVCNNMSNCYTKCVV